MALTHEGKEYLTIAEARTHFGVAEKTIYDWIHKGIVPEPDRLERGAREIYVFDEAYFARADAALKQHRMKKRRS